MENGGISSAATVSRTAAAATLTAKRVRMPGSGGTRCLVHRACSASRCAPATTTSERHTAIASGSATLFGLFVLRTFMARTAYSGSTASTPRNSRSAIHASQYPQSQSTAHRPTMNGQSDEAPRPPSRAARYRPTT